MLAERSRSMPRTVVSRLRLAATIMLSLFPVLHLKADEKVCRIYAQEEPSADMLKDCHQGDIIHIELSAKPDDDPYVLLLTLPSEVSRLCDYGKQILLDQSPFPLHQKAYRTLSCVYSGKIRDELPILDQKTFSFFQSNCKNGSVGACSLLCRAGHIEYCKK